MRHHTKTPFVSKIAVRCKDSWRHLCLHRGVRNREDEGNVSVPVTFQAVPKMQQLRLVGALAMLHVCWMCLHYEQPKKNRTIYIRALQMKVSAFLFFFLHCVFFLPAVDRESAPPIPTANRTHGKSGCCCLFTIAFFIPLPISRLSQPRIL